MKSIEAHFAFVWDCDNCGVENFGRCVQADLSGDDREFVKEQHDMSEYELVNKEFFTVPLVVTCKSCGTEYNTIDVEYEDE